MRVLTGIEVKHNRRYGADCVQSLWSTEAVTEIAAPHQNEGPHLAAGLRARTSADRSGARGKNDVPGSQWLMKSSEPKDPETVRLRRGSAPIPRTAQLSAERGALSRLPCSNWGSIRARRARVWASRRSSFRLLSAMSFTCLGLATMISCPRLRNRRLTQGEWVPTSIAIRARPIHPNVPVIPALVVATSPSRRISLVAQQAVATGLVSQIHPNRDGLLCEFGFHRGLRILSRTATLLHGRSPLHFEWVCGSLSHPVRAGLLIPSRRVHRASSKAIHLDEKSPTCRLALGQFRIYSTAL
jgi:hypothetical protein